MIAVVAAALVGITFLMAGGAKLRAGPEWPALARELGAPRWVAAVLPWFELVLGGLLVAQVARTAAATVAFVVLAGFTVLIVRRLAQGSRPPCACFGSWSARPLGVRHLVRNGVLMVLALVAALA